MRATSLRPRALLLALLPALVVAERLAARAQAAPGRLLRPTAAALAVATAGAASRQPWGRLPTWSPGTVLRLRQVLDRNQDGVVDMSEFMSSVELGGIGDQSYDEARRRSIREGFQRLFRAADIDGDGRLGDRELEYMAHLVGTAVSDRRGSSKEQVLIADDFGTRASADLLALLDANGDGQVDKWELTSAIRESIKVWGLAETLQDPGLGGFVEAIFERADIDGDGRLDRRELHFASCLLNSALGSETYTDDVILALVLGPRYADDSDFDEPSTDSD